MYRHSRGFMMNLQAVMFYSEWGTKSSSVQEPTTPTPSQLFHSEPDRYQGVTFYPSYLLGFVLSVSLFHFFPCISVFLTYSECGQLTRFTSFVKLINTFIFCSHKHCKQEEKSKVESSHNIQRDLTVLQL